MSMNLASTPALLTLAPWLQRGNTPRSIVWVTPSRENRVPTTVPNSIVDVTPADIAEDNPAIAFVVGRLRKGLSTGLRFATIRDGATAFVLLSTIAERAA